MSLRAVPPQEIAVRMLEDGCRFRFPLRPLLTRQEHRMTRRGSKPRKNLEQLVKDAEVRLKKLEELSEKINELVDAREQKMAEESGSCCES